MSNNQTSDKIHHIQQLVEQTNNTKSRYLAMICGMWCQVYKVPFNKNPFISEDNVGRDIIYSWNSGWRASEQASDLSAGIINKQEKHDKARFEEITDKAKKAVGKFFGKK